MSPEESIFDRHMRPVSHHASIVALFGSEDAISEKKRIQWFVHERYRYYDEYGDIYDSHYGYYHDLPPKTPPPDPYDDFFNGNDNGREYFIERIYTLKTPDERFQYASIDENAYNTPSIRRLHEERAIRDQLNSFNLSYEILTNTEGLLYHIVTQFPMWLSAIDENETDFYFFTFSNVAASQQTRDFFESMRVFCIIDSEQMVFRGSSPYSYFYDHYWQGTQIDGAGNAVIYLAFTSEFVNEQASFYKAIRSAHIFDISIIIGCFVLALAALIVLLMSVGKQNILVDGAKVRKAEISFSLLDKPYLDVGLAFAVLWTVLTVALSYHILYDLSWYWNIDASVNTTALNVLYAIMIALILPPALFWLMSFVKRLRAGQSWKHTLVYAIIYSLLFGSLRFIVNKGKSMWAGTRLMLRVGLISAATFFTLFIIGYLTAETRSGIVLFLLSIMTTAVVATLLSLYAKRLRNLELGARAACEGRYDVPINAGGGELGNIAYSINSISAGINVAVEERMKSERLKTELITNVSHDIRTPLTSIITYTDLLEHEGLDCEKAPEYLSILKQKSLRLKTLTEELFEAAKATTGNIDVNLADLNIVSLINQVLGELDNSIVSSGLDLRINLPDKLIAIADGRLMHRVMENLFSNVFNYSLPNSRVYLDVFQTPYKEVCIDVKNISATALNFDPSELIERFKRGDDSRTDGGSGLGLSIVQSFVSAQGGRFEIKIDGDLFKATVTLPMPPPVLPMTP